MKHKTLVSAVWISNCQLLWLLIRACSNQSHCTVVPATHGMAASQRKKLNAHCTSLRKLPKRHNYVFQLLLHCYFCCGHDLTAVLLHDADGQELHTHANRRAPRCLPCNYTDPAEQSFRSPPEQYPAPRVGALGAEPLPVHAGSYVMHALPLLSNMHIFAAARDVCTVVVVTAMYACAVRYAACTALASAALPGTFQCLYNW